jgi:glycerate-2-kinase
VHTQIVGSVADALRGAAREARKLGYTPAIVSKRTTGEALHVGASLGTRARRVRGAGPKCLLFGGETTVTLGDDPGHGGRNQEVALSAAREIAGQLDTVVFSVGTDGVDGPTDAAGAIVDGTTWARIRQAGLDPEQALRGHDAHPALAASRDLVLTGPTGTNVMDVFGILVR